jgi:hypothetical protein
MCHISSATPHFGVNINDGSRNCFGGQPMGNEFPGADIAPVLPAGKHQRSADPSIAWRLHESWPYWGGAANAIE